MKRKLYELDLVDRPRVRLTPVLLSDIEKALAGVKSVITVKEIEELEAWNRSQGQ